MIRAIKYLFIIYILTYSIQGIGQADVSMATSIYNRSNYNPAFTARINYFYVFSNTRQQWIGFEGAPKVYYIQGSEYLHNLRSAFGLSFMSDQIGNTTAINPMATYAYRIKGERNRVFTLGLSGGVFSRTIDGSLYDSDILNDPTIDYSIEETTQPDANVGMEFISSRFVFGLSSTHLFSIRKSENSYHNTNHRYGYLIYKNNDFEHFFYKVGIQIINRNNLTIYEGNTLIRLKHGTGLLKGPKEFLDFGFAYRFSRHNDYRSSNQLAFMMGLLLSPDIRVAYSYDQSFIEDYYQNTTHEIMLEYRLFNKAASPRLCGRK